MSCRYTTWFWVLSQILLPDCEIIYIDWKQSSRLFSLLSQDFWQPKQFANPKNGDRCLTILAETEMEEPKWFPGASVASIFGEVTRFIL
jgi:hypothetical protein